MKLHCKYIAKYTSNVILGKSLEISSLKSFIQIIIFIILLGVNLGYAWEKSLDKNYNLDKLSLGKIIYPGNYSIWINLDKIIQGFKAGTLYLGINESFKFKDIAIYAETSSKTTLLLHCGILSDISSFKSLKYVRASLPEINPFIFWRMVPGNYTIIVLSERDNKIRINFRVYPTEYGWIKRAEENYARIKYSQMPTNIFKIGSIAILVDEYTFNKIRDHINIFVDDIKFLYSINSIIVVRNFRDIFHVRETLKQLYFNYSSNICGAILIGRIPLPYMKGDNKTYMSTRFYEDLDGIFKFKEGVITLWNNTNGLEIWVSVITPPKALSRSNFTYIKYLRLFFRKMHLYMTGYIRVPARGFDSIDKDWRPWVTQHWEEFTSLYKYEGGYSFIGGLASTYSIHADEYKFHIQSGYELSAGWIHGGFSFAGGGNFDKGNHWGAREIGPGALVHIMATCGFSNIDEEWCHALCFLFGRSISIATVGPTKSEGILEAYALFGPLSEYMFLGDAFLYWLNYRFTDDPWNNLSRHKINTTTHSWGLGVVLYGHPFVLLRGEPTYIEVESLDFKKDLIVVKLKIIDNHLSPVSIYPVHVAIKYNNTWYEKYANLTDKRGEITIKLNNTDKTELIAIYGRGAYLRDKIYRPCLTYINLTAYISSRDKPTIKSIKYCEDWIFKLGPISLNVTANVENATSVMICYSINNGTWYTVSMFKTSNGDYFIRIPANEGDNIRFFVKAISETGVYSLSPIYEFNVSKKPLWEKIIYTKCFSLILAYLMILSIAIIIIKTRRYMQKKVAENKA